MEVIKDITGYYIKINNGKPERVNSINQATKFENNNAKKCINNQIAKRIRNRYYVENIDKSDTSEKEKYNDDLKKYLEKLDIDIEIKNISDFFQKLNDYKTELEKELSIKDKELCDIEHAIEFYKFNACEGFKMYKMMHEARVERRRIKKMMLKIDIVKNSNLDEWSTGIILKRLEGINNMKYRPRILDELFQNQ